MTTARKPRRDVKCWNCSTVNRYRTRCSKCSVWLVKALNEKENSK